MSELYLFFFFSPLSPLSNNDEIRYRPVLFADFLSAEELVVVEEPWLKIMQKLPDPLFRQRFGT